MQIRRGTNISHWLSQSKRRGEERRGFFTRDDVLRIRDYGFDHIRLPVDEEQLFDESGGKVAEAFDLLDGALDWGHAAGLRVIIDLHILRSHYFMDDNPPLFADPAEAQRFASLWRTLGAHLRSWSNEQVAYELMNEPVAHDHDDWNRVAHIALAAIRETEPDRLVLLGSNKWSQCATFDALKVPDDERLILTFHFYNPMLVTHYRASWTELRDYDGPTGYPGVPVPEAVLQSLAEPLASVVRRYNKPYDRAALLTDLAKPLAVRKRTGLPLYCGEFGAYKMCPQDVRLRWYRDVISVFDECDIAWSNWDWRGGFGIVDEHRKDTGIAAVLLGGRPL